MRLPSPISGPRGNSAGPAARTSGQDGRRVSTGRGPALALHLSGGTLAWAVIDGTAGPLLVAAGSIELAGAAPGAVLARLVAERDLPRAAARVAVPGSVVLLAAAEAAAAPPAEPLDGVTDVVLADGRILRAAVDRDALSAALAMCREAGVEVVGAEPEALALARALAQPPAAATGLAAAAPDGPVALVWRSALAVSAFLVEGDAVVPLGRAPLSPASSAAATADVASRLLAGSLPALVVAASTQGDGLLLAHELGLRSHADACSGDPLERIRVGPGGPGDAEAAAGAVGLGIEGRGLPRVNLPVRALRLAAPPAEADAEPLTASEPATPAAVPAPAAPAPARRRRAAGNRAVAAAVASLVVSGALVGVWALTERSSVRDRLAVRDTLARQLAAIPEPTAPTRRLLVLGADRRGRVDAIAAVLGSRAAWERILREVSSVLPQDAWLSSLDAGGSAGSTLRLTGYATSQQAVALSLSRLALVSDLADVRLERSVRATVQGRSVVRFSIRAGVRRAAS